MDRTSLTRYAWLSILAALLTIGLKAGAYGLSGSVGLLSDALESGVNLVAAVVALAALSVAARPPDDGHNFGHDKAEYFSSGVEGTLIMLAAASIAYAGIQRLLHPRPIEQAGLSLAIALVASVLNFGVARVLLHASKQHQSITLEADSHHLMTDVWTSAGVVLGVGAASVTNLHWLDAVIALVVALNILRTGIDLLRRSLDGLMDRAIDPQDLALVTELLHRYQAHGIRWHALRTRQSGPRSFMEVHILVPGDWTVQAGHDLLEAFERELRSRLPRMTVHTHLEPMGDPAAEQDAAQHGSLADRHY